MRVACGLIRRELPHVVIISLRDWHVNGRAQRHDNDGPEQLRTQTLATVTSRWWSCDPKRSATRHPSFSRVR